MALENSQYSDIRYAVLSKALTNVTVESKHKNTEMIITGEVGKCINKQLSKIPRGENDNFSGVLLLSSVYQELYLHLIYLSFSCPA